MHALLRLFMATGLAVCLLTSPPAIAGPSGRAETVQLRALLGQAESLRVLGRYREAGEVLDEALALALSLQDTASQTAILNLRGDIAVATGRPVEAEKILAQALALAQKLARPDLLAAIQINFGNLHALRGQRREALAAYKQGAAYGRQGGSTLLQGQALSNAARASALEGENGQAIALADEAGKLAATLEHSRDKTFLLLSLGQLYGRLADGAGLPRAHQALTDALSEAEATGDVRARSYALGYLAQLYERQGRDDEALELNRRAIAALQEVDAPEIAYRWYWQQGRLKNRHRDAVGAIADYRLAVHHLQTIRADLPVTGAAGQSSFREVLGPLYFELADLLLQGAAGVPPGERKQTLLREARNTIELSKAAELQDYFRDSCVAARQERLKGPARGIGPGVAVIYPILLPDRLELVADFSDSMRQFTVPIPSQKVVDAVRKFRIRLEKRTTREYLPYGQKLYDWLIRPLEAEFASHGIKTLVFVPDGALRTIPMSALHDGKDFLITHYAVATTPSLALTDIQALPVGDSPHVLLNGLTQAVQGFSELPNVEAELQEIGQLYPGKTLKDREYVVGKVEQELDRTPYSVVHIASHGQFESDVRQSFLLAYDGKLTMDGLENMIAPSRYRDQPISLLTLSACQTAAGDDRAALGLAGVAVKAGASSALASLWFINDQSASMLVADFYTQLREPGTSKAHALQNAQLRMLADKRFRHPGYWSPFLLIGNWL